MKDYSIELFRKNVSRDLNILETSYLKKVNPKLYNELKAMFDSLDKNISLYESKTGKVTREDLGNEWATLSALFDFYMDNIGSKEVINYQVSEIKENLEKIAQELNQNNYEEIAKKLKASLDLYSKILNVAFNTNEINVLINRFNYQVLKYKIEDLILDDSKDLNIYIPFILNDIEAILNSSAVSSNIKGVLRMYAIDKSLILDNFIKVMQLIVLAETKKQVTDEELNEYLEKVIYKESDIQKEYHEPSKEMREKAYGTSTDLEKIFKYEKDYAKEAVPVAVLEHIRIGSFRESRAAETLIEYNFKDVRYLFDALFSKKQISWAVQIENEYANKGIDVSYEFICTLIAYLDTLSPAELAAYIIKTNNEFLINYFIKNKINFFNEDFINYIVSSKNSKLMKCLEENLLNISIGEIIYTKLNNESKMKAIKNAILKNRSNRDKLLDIFNLFDRIKDENLIKDINEIIIGFNDIDILCEYARRLNGTLGYNIAKILNQIDEGSFENELLNVLYDTNSAWGKILINNNENKWQFEFGDFSIGEPVFSSLTPFEAAYVSNRLIQKYHLLPFVRLHYRARLNWTHLLELSKELSQDEKEEFNKYFYLGNKELFFKEVKDFRYEFALKMINEYPSSVIDFLKYLHAKEIISLPTEALSIFKQYYQEKIDNENVSLSDRVHNTLSKSAAYYQDIPDIIELLTYIMLDGTINNEILMYAKTMSFASNLNDLFVAAVGNTKLPYLRASFAPKLHYLSASDWNIIFLSDKEKEDILNNGDSEDAKDLKFRKYYGDLLKLIPSVPENIKYRIVIEITKSKIEEYINYIVVNYPELIDIILENTDDNNLYKKIMEMSLNSGGRK